MPCIVTGYPSDAASDAEMPYDLEVEILQCDMCGLALMERDDLERAGASARVPLPNVDAETLHQYFQAESELDRMLDVQRGAAAFGYFVTSSA